MDEELMGDDFVLLPEARAPELMDVRREGFGDVTRIEFRRL